MAEVFVKPKLTDKDIASLVFRLYGFKISSIKAMDSYYDTNYHFLVDEDGTVCNNNIKANIDKNGYTLKILNVISSRNSSSIEVQHKLIKATLDAGIKTASPIVNTHGDEWSLETLQSTTGVEYKYLVRVFNFLPGIVLRYINKLSPALCYDVGRVAGKLDEAFKAVEKPVGWTNDFNPWDMQTIPDLLNDLRYISDQADQCLLHDVIINFRSRVLQNAEKWQKGFIHGDIHRENILVVQATHSQIHDDSGQKSKEEDYQFDSIFDYGDFAYSLLIFEISISMLYFMLYVKEADVVTAPGKILQGYLEHVTLSDAEELLLRSCVCARAAQSIIKAAVSRANDTDNEYAQTDIIIAWTALRKLWKMKDFEILSEWKKA